MKYILGLVVLILIIYYCFSIKENFNETKELTKEIVIARYNEDLEWIKEEPFNKYPIIIYNKGNNNNFIKTDKVKAVINLPNVGNETHTYLYHIINNYDNLADITIFLQGSINLPNKYQRAKDMIYYMEKTNDSVFSAVSYRNVKEDFYNFKIDYYPISHAKNKQENSDPTTKPSNIRPFGKWYEYHFGDKHINKVTYNSLFCLSKKDIHKHPKEYYEKFIKEVDTYPNHEVVHYFERAWQAIFT